jgi:hypothetical protein
MKKNRLSISCENNQIRKYAFGWNIENLEKVIKQEINDKNLVHLKIRKENIDDDIKKLKGNIIELSNGTKKDKKTFQVINEQ